MAKIKASELMAAEANFVSLVPKGANRIPFRITKGDRMINLSNIGQLLAKSAGLTAAAPTILAGCVAKTANQDMAKARFEAAGLDVSNPVEAGDMIVFSQTDAEDPKGLLLKLDEDTGLMIGNIEKGFYEYNFEGMTFGEVAGTEAFLPSLGMAADMLRYTIQNILEAEDTAKGASEKISTAVADYGKYVETLASAIPESAFKADVTPKVEETAADEAVEDNAPADAEVEKAGDAEVDTNVDADAAEGDAPVADEVPAEADASDENVEPDVEEAEEAPAEEEAADEVAKSDPADALKDVIAAALAPITEALGDVKKTVAASNEAVTGLTNRVDAVEQGVAKADKALRGTVSAAPTGDDETIRVGKTDTPSIPPLLDTGFQAERR